MAAELEALGIALVVLDQSIDTATPAGRLLFNVLGSIAEFGGPLPPARRASDGLRKHRSSFLGKHGGRHREPGILLLGLRIALTHLATLNRLMRCFIACALYLLLARRG